MSRVTRLVQGGAYSGPRSEPGGQNTPRAGRSVAAVGSPPVGLGFVQQVEPMFVPEVETLLDDFNRADGNVAVGGPWVSTAITGPTATNLRVISNQVGSLSGSQSAYMTTGITGDNCDILVDCPVLSGDFNWWLLLTNPGVASASGYRWNISPSGGLSGLTRFLGGAPTSLDARQFTVPSGSTFWFYKRGPTLALYYKPPGGSSYTMLSGVTDAAPYSPVSGIVGIDLSDTTTRLDDLRGGPQVVYPVYNDTGSGTVTASGTGSESNFISTPYDVVLDVDNPISHWKLGETGVATDRKGVRNLPAISGPISSGPALVRNNASDLANVFTPTGQTFGLSASTGIGAPYNTSTWTFEAWAQRTGAAAMSVVRYLNKASISVFAGRFRFVGYDATPTTQVLDTVSPLGDATIGVARYVALTYDGTNLIAYIDGVEAGRLAMTGSNSVPNDLPSIAANGDMDGVIDEVAWYGTALSPARVQAHYAAGLPPSGTYTDTGSGTIAIGGTATETCVYTDSSPFIKNPSFETDLSGWTQSNTAGLTGIIWARDNTWAQDGSWSLHMQATSGATGAAYSLNAFALAGTSAIPISPLLPYTVSAWVNPISPMGTAYGVRLAIYWYTASGAAASTPSNISGYFTSSDPQRIAYRVAAPADAAFAAPRLLIYWGAGAPSNTTLEAYFDAVTFSGDNLVLDGTGTETYTIPVTYTDSSSGTVTVNGSGVEALAYTDSSPVVKNPSFETDLSSWTQTTAAGMTGVIWARDNTWAQDGSWSLHMKGTSGASGSAYSLTALAPAGVAGIPISPLWPYTIAAWVNPISPMGSTYGIRLAIQWYTASGAVASTPSNVSVFYTPTDPQRLAFRVSAPADAAFAAPRLYIYWGSAAPSNTTLEAYFDSILFSGDNLILDGTSTENQSSSVFDAGSGIITASGTGVESLVFGDTVTGTITGSGTGAESVVRNASATATIAVSGSAVESTLYSDLRTVTGIVSGTGVESVVFADSGTVISTASGTGTDTRIYTDSLAGSTLISGTSSESLVFADTGTDIVVVSGTGFDSSISGLTYTDTASGTVTAQGTDTEIYAGIDSGVDTVVVSGTGSDVFLASDTSIGTSIVSGTGTDSSVHTGSGIGSTIVSGTSSDTEVYTDTGSSTIAVTGTSTDTRVYPDTGTVTLSVSGTGTEANLYTDTSTVTVVIAGTGLDTAAYGDSGVSTEVISGISTESIVYTASATGTTSVTGTGTEVNLYTDISTVTVVGAGTGSDTAEYGDSGVSSEVTSGTSTESIVYTASATGTTSVTGSSSEAEIHNGSTVGTSVLNGTGIDSGVYGDTASGTTLITGTGVDSAAILIGYIDAGTGQIAVSGTRVESQSHTSTTTGSVVGNGTSLESQVYTNSASGSLLVDGTGIEVLSYTNSATGSLFVTGVSTESQSNTDTASGSLLVDGTSNESQNHSSTTSGFLVADGTGVESQSHTSTAIDLVVVSGTGAESQIHEILYTDIATGSVTSTGTGFDSLVFAYNDTVSGTVTNTGIGFDSVSYSNTVTGIITLLDRGSVEECEYTDAATDAIVVTGSGRDSYTQSVQPTPISTVIALNRIRVEVQNKTPIRTMVTSTAPIRVQIVLQHGIRVAATKPNEMKVLIANH